MNASHAIYLLMVVLELVDAAGVSIDFRLSTNSKIIELEFRPSFSIRVIRVTIKFMIYE